MRIQYTFAERVRQIARQLQQLASNQRAASASASAVSSVSASSTSASTSASALALVSAAPAQPSQVQQPVVTASSRVSRHPDRLADRYIAQHGRPKKRQRLGESYVVRRIHQHKKIS